MVTVSYCWDNCMLYRRTTDASDRSVLVEFAMLSLLDDTVELPEDFAGIDAFDDTQITWTACGF